MTHECDPVVDPGLTLDVVSIQGTRVPIVTTSFAPSCQLVLGNLLP